MNLSQYKNMNGKGLIFSVIVIPLLLIAVAILGYYWFFCRFYVPPMHMAIVTAKNGVEPERGEILVKKGQKGIWQEVLSEGRHFLDPINYEVKIMPATIIPLGKIGIVSAKVGKELPPGEIIAPSQEYKGVWKEVLGPGVYRMNPEGYKIEITDAINIPPGYVGVVTSQTGKAPEPGKFAKLNEKGVMQDILQPGLYYINRYAYQVNVIEIGMNQVTMTDSARGQSVVQMRNQLNNANNALQEMAQNTLNFQSELRRKNVSSSVKKLNFANESPARSMDANSPAMAAGKKDKSGKVEAAAAIFGVSRAVEFPSRDGFKVSLDMTVEFELMPEKIALIYLLYGDLPQVVEKIILPQVLSVSRLKGSSYQAQDFIMGDGREKFQDDLRVELVKILASKNIMVHNAIIRNVEIPNDILAPIQAVSLAKEQNLTNVSMQQTAKTLAELNTETELIEQKRQEVQQQTAKIVGAIGAERKKEVASIQAETALKVAELNLKKSELVAKINQLDGETDVKVKFLIENEKAQGEKMKSSALGDSRLLSKMVMVNALSPTVETKIIYAGDGTLWTDLNAAALQLPSKNKK